MWSERRGRIGLVALVVALTSAEPVQGQLADLCGPLQLGEAFVACVAGGVVEEVRDGLGVGHSGAAPLPGTASALGRRLGTTPRIAFSGRVGFVRFDRTDADSWDTGRSSSGWSPVFGAAAGIGVFDGLSVAPTVSGVLGVDLLGDVSTLRLPSDDGFDGASLAWGYGIRVGILRESFTLPGASISVMRRSGASISMAGEDGSIDADVTTTSVRATVGKELAGFGVHGGVGWDRVSAEGSLLARAGGGPGTTVNFDDESDTLTTFFGGIARTFLVTSIGVDFGWSGEVVFGSLSLRLTL